MCFEGCISQQGEKFQEVTEMKNDLFSISENLLMFCDVSDGLDKGENNEKT